MKSKFHNRRQFIHTTAWGTVAGLAASIPVLAQVAVAAWGKVSIRPAARLVWPVYPHHPYTNQPEKGLDHAVGALSVPLRLKARPGHYVRPGEQEIRFALEVE